MAIFVAILNWQYLFVQPLPVANQRGSWRCSQTTKLLNKHELYRRRLYASWNRISMKILQQHLQLKVTLKSSKRAFSGSVLSDYGIILLSCYELEETVSLYETYSFYRNIKFIEIKLKIDHIRIYTGYPKINAPYLKRWFILLKWEFSPMPMDRAHECSQFELHGFQVPI